MQRASPPGKTRDEPRRRLRQLHRARPGLRDALQCRAKAGSESRKKRGDFCRRKDPVRVCEARRSAAADSSRPRERAPRKQTGPARSETSAFAGRAASGPTLPEWIAGAGARRRREEMRGDRGKVEFEIAVGSHARARLARGAGAREGRRRGDGLRSPQPRPIRGRGLWIEQTCCPGALPPAPSLPPRRRRRRRRIH